MSTAQLPPQPSESDRGASRARLTHARIDDVLRTPLLKTALEGEVVLYLFLGGIMALGTSRDDRRRSPEREADLARSARYVSMVLAAVCPLVLITHLAPERSSTCCASRSSNRDVDGVWDSSRSAFHRRWPPRAIVTDGFCRSGSPRSRRAVSRIFAGLIADSCRYTACCSAQRRSRSGRRQTSHSALSSVPDLPAPAP